MEMLLDHFILPCPDIRIAVFIDSDDLDNITLKFEKKGDCFHLMEEDMDFYEKSFIGLGPLTSYGLKNFIMSNRGWYGHQLPLGRTRYPKLIITFSHINLIVLNGKQKEIPNGRNPFAYLNVNATRM